MKTLAGMALGFAMMPAVVGLIVVFAWLSIRFHLRSVDCALGAAIGIAVLVLGAIIAFKVFTPTLA